MYDIVLHNNKLSILIMNIDKLNRIHIIRFIFVILISSSTCGVFEPSTVAFAAETTTDDEEDTEINFIKVSTETNPVPNKPFNIYAEILPPNRNADLIVTLSTPEEIAITTPIVSDLSWSKTSSGRVASWIVIASQSGTYEVVMTARSNNPVDIATFRFDIVVGSINSLIVTTVDVPGEIYPNDVFTVGITLKNTAAIPDENVRAQVTIPTGLHLLDGFSSVPIILNSTKETTANWRIRAETSGTYMITFGYSSQNSGVNSIDASVNIGNRSVLDVRVSHVLLNGADSMNNLAGSGDRNIPLVVNIINTGTEELYNIDAALVLDKPFKAVTSQNGTSIFLANNTKSFFISKLAVGENVDLVYFVDIDESTEPQLYQSVLMVSASNGRESFQKTLSIPISISTEAPLSIKAHLARIIENTVTPIVLDIKNNGDTVIHSLQILSVAGGYTSLDTPVWIEELGIQSTKSVTLKILAVNVTDSQLPLSVNVKYESKGQSLTETYQVAIQSEALPNFQVQSVLVNPNISYPGDVGIKVDVDILNYGIVNANDVSTRLELPQSFSPAYGNSDVVFLGNIESSETKTATFFVNVERDTNAGTYPFSVNVEHAKGSDKIDFNFIVTQKAVFQVVDIDYSQLYPGAANAPFKITIRNTGTAAAETVTTKLLGGNLIPGVKSNEITAVGNVENIGTVLANQSFTTTFLVNLDPTSPPGDKTITVEINWMQGDSDTFVQTVIVPYSLLAGPPYLLYYGGVPWTYINIIVVLAIALYVFVIKRRERLKKIESIWKYDSSLPSEMSDSARLETQMNPSLPSNRTPVETKEIRRNEIAEASNELGKTNLLSENASQHFKQIQHTTTDSIDDKIKKMCFDVKDSQHAIGLDQNMEQVFTIPAVEIHQHIETASGIKYLIIDDHITQLLADAAESIGVKFIAGQYNDVQNGKNEIIIKTFKELEI